MRDLDQLVEVMTHRLEAHLRAHVQVRDQLAHRRCAKTRDIDAPLLAPLWVQRAQSRFVAIHSLVIEVLDDLPQLGVVFRNDDFFVVRGFVFA